jgi:transcription-repair coupling factor (superfamily II helicase)
MNILKTLLDIELSDEKLLINNLESNWKIFDEIGKFIINDELFLKSYSKTVDGEKLIEVIVETFKTIYFKIISLEIKEEIIEKEKPIINVSTHITKNYVNDDNIKIEIHKLISKIDSKEKLYEVNAELKDRFGQVSEEMIIYMYSKWLEVLANSLNINDITENNLFVEFSLSKSIVDKVDVQNLFVYSNNVTNKVRFNYKNNRLYIKILLSGLEKHFVYYLTDILDYINKKV